MDTKLDIESIHPDLEPVTTPPSLFSFYGCGFRLLGNRDYSEETQSSVKTLYFTLFYVPLIPIRAYRVITDKAQYYFLGKTKVSGFAKKASTAAVSLGALAIAGFGTQQYFTSDSYVNGKVMKSAELALENGALGDAMLDYKKLYIESDRYKRDAQLGISKLMKVDTLQKTSSSDFATIIDAYGRFQIPPLPKTPQGIYELSLERIKSHDGNDNLGVHKLLHAAQILNPDGEDLSEIDLSLVSSIVETDPNNLEAANELAEAKFMSQDIKGAKALLMPLQEKLSDTEGARILGQIFIAEGNNQAAYPLLSAYTSERLRVMQTAEETFLNSQNTLWDAEFNILRDGNGPESFYNAYNAKTSEIEQQLFVDEYITEKLNKNEIYLSQLEAYRESTSIVPVVMDFGILQLRTAETLTSDTERSAELKSAETTFLSIRNIVGDTDEYKIYLGQVYFWLGKQEEGQALFDEILSANNRASDSLLAIATTLRALGKMGMAQTLSEEAYNNASDDTQRFQAANFLQLVSNTIEEKYLG